MKKEINESEFIREFDECNRGNNFSIEGRRVLYNYFEEFEDFELDVIAICCDFSEYESVEEYLNDYYGKDEYNNRVKVFCDENDINIKDFEDYEDDFKSEIFEELEGKTTILKIDDNSFLIQCY